MHPHGAGSQWYHLPCIIPVQVLFPLCLTARQRAILHEVAEEHGFIHSSTDAGDQRQISICSRADSPNTTKARPYGTYCRPNMIAGTFSTLPRPHVFQSSLHSFSWSADSCSYQSVHTPAKENKFFWVTHAYCSPHGGTLVRRCLIMVGQLFQTRSYVQC